MSGILRAVINENRELVISPSDGFAGEHNAEIIELDIGPFAAEDYEYFILNFEVFGSKGKLISNIIRTGDDEPSYIDNGVIYCPLTSQLTASGRLKLQLEAHKNTENGEVVRKSSVAELSFKPSVMGADDMMDSGSSVYGRLEEVEDRLDGIDAENFGGKISAARAETAAVGKRVDALENRAENAEISITQVQGRVSTIESYKIPEKFSGFEDRIDELEKKPQGILEIPVASDKTVGGIRLSANSPFYADAGGTLGMRYSSLNPNVITVLVSLALLSVPGEFETFSSEDTDSASSFVYDCSLNLLNGMLNGFAFASFNRGSVEYINENFENATLSVEPNCIYVFKKENDKIQIKKYFGNELRKLIAEGI